MCDHGLTRTGQTSLSGIITDRKNEIEFGAPGLANSSQFLLRAAQDWHVGGLQLLEGLGRTVPAARLPALYALKLGLPFKFRSAPAMIERAELPVHKNKTLYCPCTTILLKYSGLHPYTSARLMRQISNNANLGLVRHNI